MGFNCFKTMNALRGGSLLFTTKFPEFLVLTVSGVSGLNNLTIVLLQEMRPISTNEIF